MSDKTLIVEGLTVAFEGRSVVRDLSFTLQPGRCVALVGESGSGKSVSARSLVGLAGRGAQVSARQASFGGHDLLDLSERQWRAVRGKDIGFVLQDALVSLDRCGRWARKFSKCCKRISTATDTAVRRGCMRCWSGSACRMWPCVPGSARGNCPVACVSVH